MAGQKLVWNDEVIIQGMRSESKNLYTQGFASFKARMKEKKLNERLSCTLQIFLFTSEISEIFLSNS